MKLTHIAAAALAGIAGSAALTPRAQTAQPAGPPVPITVHLDREGARVSPSLYGIFFEEINHAGDGGLYAEMVRNRDFEEDARAGNPTGLAGWTAAGAARASVLAEKPLTAANAHSLRIEIPAAGAGVTNSGYWGIGLTKGAAYSLSLYARRDAGLRGPLAVRLEGASGRVYAEAKLDGLTEEWKRFSCTLRPNAGDAHARLSITANGPGTLWLDVVSLFPARTFKGRANGMRADLAGHLLEMKPAFLRFPGGCYVEGGDRLADAFRWKETVGDPAARPGHLNATWNYRSTDGLGYHEYLQLCEDLGAEPLYVANCGMSHKEFVPVNELEPWIQEALDAIEYANGPVTSKWGALRAKNGHPEPFNLKYLEIGNENGLFGPQFGGSVPMYEVRYKPFYDAIKAKYPEVVTISNTRVRHPMEFVDDHYYNSPDWFWANTNLYDRTDRNGPKVYVGEYAVTSNCGTGNLRAALAEAAFMTGLERNGDLVQLASYAPLFVNANDRKWNPDAIVFDSTRSYGTPSYWVQKLFAEHRPDVNFVTEAPPLPTAGGKGTIGLGTWRTQAEYRDVEVIRNGRVVYRSDFSEGAKGWKPVRGSWRVADGAYRQTAPEENRRSLLDSPELAGARDYTVRLKARKLGGAEGFLVMFRTEGEGDWYWWNIGGWNNTEHSIERAASGGSIPFGPHVRGSVETGRWYDVRIEAEGDRIRCYLDGKLIHDVRDRGVPTLAAVAGRAGKGGEVVVKVVNGAETAREIDFRLDGARGLAPTASVTTLTAESMDAENSLSAPDRISPKSSTFKGVAPRFRTTVPARSLTIWRFRTR